MLIWAHKQAKKKIHTTWLSRAICGHRRAQHQNPSQTAPACLTSSVLPCCHASSTACDHPALHVLYKQRSASAAATAKAGKPGQESGAASLQNTLLQPTSSTKLSAPASEARVKHPEKEVKLLVSSKPGFGLPPARARHLGLAQRACSLRLSITSGLQGSAYSGALGAGLVMYFSTDTGRPPRVMLVHSVPGA